MGIGKRIKEARLSKNLTQEELAKKLGITKGSIANYENETSHPKESVMYALINTLGVDANYLFQDCVNTKKAVPLSNEEQRLISDYNSLDAHGKSVVSSVLSEEMKRIRELSNPPVSVPVSKIIPLIGNSFAAGRGDPDFGNPWEDYEVPSDSKAEFAVRINGDSMEPYLHDGSIALGVKQTPRDGDVAALLINGEFLCKQVCEDNFGNLYLFALNRNRKDADQIIWNNSDSSVSCFGTIIMPHRIPLPRTV